MDINKAKHSLSEALKQLERLDKVLENEKSEAVETAINIMKWELKETERMLDNEINAGKPKQTMKCSWCDHVQEVREPKVVWKSGVTRNTQYRQTPYYSFKCERCGKQSYEKT